MPESQGPDREQAKAASLDAADDSVGRAMARADAKPEPPSEDKVDEAVREQKDLLAEFDKIADELNNVLANLEGSTLVKRFKASSRKQQQVAGKLASLVSNSFGVSDRRKGIAMPRRLPSWRSSEIGEQPRDIAHHGRHGCLFPTQSMHELPTGAR